MRIALIFAALLLAASIVTPVIVAQRGPDARAWPFGISANRSAVPPGLAEAPPPPSQMHGGSRH